MQNPLFNNVVDDWFEKHRLRIAESTAYNYAKAIPSIKNYFYGYHIQDITPHMAHGYVQYTLGKFNTSSSARLYCKAFKLILDHAIICGYIHFNPCSQISMPKKRRAEISVFSVNEIYSLMESDGPQWVKDGIMIAFRTGMRPGEIYALKWSDINLDVGYISVQRSISRACSSVKETKTPAGVRRIDIDSKLISYLKGMESRGMSEYVFPSPPKGKHQYQVPWNIAHMLRHMCENAGIQYRNFYSLRHTHATILFEMGVHPKIVQERLGHSSIKITVDTYSHIIPGIQQLAVEKLEEI